MEKTRQLDKNTQDLGSVWIRLKTEKHCSKIIFKCVNSTVRPIFNEKGAEKMRFVGPVNSA